MARGRTKVWFDGGCRPNPGQMEAAVVLRGQVNLFENMGHGGSADAEWLALIHALKLARAQGLEDFVLTGDARHVINGANAVLSGQPVRSEHAKRFVELAKEGPKVRVRWIKREQNLAGIALARRHPR